MSDLFEMFLTSPLGKAVAPKVGLPQPSKLRRGRVLASGPVALASLPGADLVAESLRLIEVQPIDAVRDDPDARVPDDEGRPKPPRYAERPGALLVDATTLTRIEELENLRAWLRPAVRALQASGRIVLVAPDPESADSVEKRAAFQAVDGLNRSLGKELREGVTTNLVYAAPGLAAPALTSTLLFLLEGRSAFVDGQSWRVGPADVAASSARALADRVVVVTGAARGIGARIAEVAARDGAQVVAVDVPAAGEALATVANTLRGSALQLDITSPDAGSRLAAHVAQTYPGRRLHGIVHNAGITRDKLLANMDETRWAAVLEVNLAAQLRLNEALLDPNVPGGLADDGRIVGVSSTSGIAGNRGQTNYGASKAGVVGAITFLAPRLAARGITVNAVAPGFIETAMTAAIPPVSREIFRRTNSLQQGGQPVDVAETICYFLDPASAGVTGQVIRVCGQNIVGA
jgi:3-oxoacyl-[acyl-carrier protein] reductase